MELGLTWPLQRLIKTPVCYGSESHRGFCWDAHCITLHGESTLLLVHCESRFTCCRFAMTAFDWARLEEIAAEEVRCGLLDAGIEAQRVARYLTAAGEWGMTRTHGRREVAFLNLAWNEVLAADLLVDRSQNNQPLLNFKINDTPCRCAGEAVIATAREHLLRYFERSQW